MKKVGSKTVEFALIYNNFASVFVLKLQFTLHALFARTLFLFT